MKTFQYFCFDFSPQLNQNLFFNFFSSKIFFHPLFIDSWNAFSSNKLFRFGEFLNISKMPQFVNTLTNFVLILVGLITMTISVWLVGKLYMYCIFTYIHIAFSVFNPIKVKPIFLFFWVLLSYKREALQSYSFCLKLKFLSNYISLKIDGVNLSYFKL